MHCTILRIYFMSLDFVFVNLMKGFFVYMSVCPNFFYVGADWQFERICVCAFFSKNQKCNKIHMLASMISNAFFCSITPKNALHSRIGTYTVGFYFLPFFLRSIESFSSYIYSTILIFPNVSKNAPYFSRINFMSKSRTFFMGWMNALVYLSVCLYI